MKEIKGIGFQFPFEGETYLSISSFESLSDADVAIFLPDLYETTYSTDYSDGGGYFQGGKLYDRSSSFRIKEHITHWEKEIISLLNRGGTLFVILAKKNLFYIHAGSGLDIKSAQNRKLATTNVYEYSNYDFIPFKDILYQNASGKAIIPTSPLVNDLFNVIQDCITFEAYIDGQSISERLFATKSKDRVLGGITQVFKGHVVYLPYIDFKKSPYSKSDIEGNVFWTEAGLKKGGLFVDCIAKIDRALKSSVQKTPRPTWLDNASFKLSQSTATMVQIDSLSKKIEKLSLERENLKALLIEQESLKDLLFETGKALENSVKNALQILGYSAENFDDGRLELDQVIISPEGHRLIGECEGKDNRDIDVTKFRQLHDSLNADFERENVKEKAFGLLIGNPQRLMEPGKRTLDFTDKCKSGAKREKIGLITTVDLFNVSRYILETNDIEYAASCRSAIIDQLGEVIKFPSMSRASKKNNTIKHNGKGKKTS